MTRREFLRLLASSVATPALVGNAGCAPALTRIDPGTGLSLGYVAGDVTSDGAIIWVRAAPDSQVFLHYSEDPSLSAFSSIGPYPVDREADFTALINVENLQPASTYYYRVAVSGKQPGHIAQFITAPRPDDAAKVCFCFSADTRESYKPFTVMTAVRAQRPDFFLYLGDTIYADIGGKAQRLPEFWAKYRRNREDLATQYCFDEVSTYVTWDDHEVADDYLPDNPLAPIGRKAFLDYWPIRRNREEPERIYRSFRWGKALEVFILDARQYRDSKKGTMLGKDQKEWLLEGISRSDAIFKFIATSVPMAGGGKDRWDGYPRERAEILGYIRQRKVTGVIFLSGDLHCASITRVPKSGGLRDITAGPLAGPVNRVTNGTASRYEFFLAENFNFAKITVDPKAEPVHALVEFIDQDNQLFYSAELKLS
jgi:alkaline phosphatase D